MEDTIVIPTIVNWVMCLPEILTDIEIWLTTVTMNYLHGPNSLHVANWLVSAKLSTLNILKLPDVQKHGGPPMTHMLEWSRYLTDSFLNGE